MGIRFNQVSYDYSSFAQGLYTAIRDINLNITEKHEFIALVGHTGSGKSTLAKHMNALIFPTSGNLEIFGNVITSKRNKKIKYNDIRKKVGLVFQFPEYQLFEETVEKDIMFGPLNFKITKEEAKKKAKEALNLVGLDDSYLSRNPYNLSGGEKKRVSIAGILAMDPDILVLDEPTSGLDPAGRRVLMNLFKDIFEKTGKTIVIITHDMDLVYQYFNRAIVMNDGELVYDGDVEKLFKEEDLVKHQLDFPNTIKVLNYLNKELNLNLNVYQKTFEDALLEIKKAVKS
ncbi:MAG: energy-coupling factor transporter ATPase [Candidatus Izemoplasmatales bacterium]|jgi:energy-coupling factor transport system ATP-binding protein|nr:energy-coupling factor transporter ATPase [Candidatus Izemoplasmatales bacterium]